MYKTVITRNTIGGFPTRARAVLSFLLFPPLQNMSKKQLYDTTDHMLIQLVSSGTTVRRTQEDHQNYAKSNCQQLQLYIVGDKHSQLCIVIKYFTEHSNKV